MPAILTINYKLRNTDRPWFQKNFMTYTELSKWLREDSIIILPGHDLQDEELEKKLLLTKLALPRIVIFIITDGDMRVNHNLFNFVRENCLEKEINSAIINPHRIIDNRVSLNQVIKILT